MVLILDTITQFIVLDNSGRAQPRSSACNLRRENSYSWIREEGIGGWGNLLYYRVAKFS